MRCSTLCLPYHSHLLQGSRVEKSLHVRGLSLRLGLAHHLILSDYRGLKKRITAIKKGQGTPENERVVVESPTEVRRSPTVLRDSDACKIPPYNKNIH